MSGILAHQDITHSYQIFWIVIGRLCSGERKAKCLQWPFIVFRRFLRNCEDVLDPRKKEWASTGSWVLLGLACFCAHQRLKTLVLMSGGLSLWVCPFAPKGRHATSCCRPWLTTICTAPKFLKNYLTRMLFSFPAFAGTRLSSGGKSKTRPLGRGVKKSPKGMD